jgi:oxygen-dependent protoporphyrinogen oxidase
MNRLPKHIVILGAGISGLTVAWQLQKQFNNQTQITLIEKESRVGGWIRTVFHEGFLFEQGPRSCRPRGNGLETLRLIEELNLQDQVITSHQAAKRRYLYSQQCLQSLPYRLLSALHPSFFQVIGKALWRDFSMPKGEGKDESIYSFFERRLGHSFTKNFIDPLVSGIYAGDMRKLSIQSCFPLCFQWEQQAGSLLKGCLKYGRVHESLSPWMKTIQKSSMFSFKEGMEVLPKAIMEGFMGEVRLNCEVQSLTPYFDKIVVKLPKQQLIEADYVISALPISALHSLLIPFGIGIDCPHANVVSVHLGYHQSVLSQKGFGYLIPFQERESILGCVWDSCVFPQQNTHQEEARLTVLLGGTQHPHMDALNNQTCLEMALAALDKHLKIKRKPDAVLIERAWQAIPQYPIGYSSRLEELWTQLKPQWSRLMVIGQALQGVAVNDCIAFARRLLIG